MIFEIEDRSINESMNESINQSITGLCDVVQSQLVNHWMTSCLKFSGNLTP